MKVNALIKEFEIMLKEHWAYELNAARKGCVDCSGAFVYAFDKYNQYVEHGSNSIVNKRIMGTLLPIRCAQPGMAAFKCRPWKDSDRGNRWYGTEPGNIYHIGLVSRDSKHVLNARDPQSGFVSSDIADGWDYVAPLTNVSYSAPVEPEREDDAPMFGNAVVTTNEGGLNLRCAASTNSPAIKEIPKGSGVQITGTKGDWYLVTTEDGTTGYAFGKYITRKEPEPVKKSIWIKDSEGRMFDPHGDFQIFTNYKPID